MRDALYFLCASAAFAQWSATSLIRQPEPNSGIKERFGTVALSSSGLCGLAAAPGCGVLCQAGSVYALTRGAVGAPFSPVNGTALLTPASAIAFGTALALSANCSVALVGAPNAFSSQGRAYAFTPCGSQPSGWCLSATLSVSDLGLPTFGSALAANAEGWAVAVGAKNSGSATGGNGYGSVWFCTAAGLLPSAATWSCEKLLPTGSSGDWLGTAVALSDNALTLAATAPFKGGQGAAYVWARPAGSAAAGSGAWGAPVALDPNAGACSLGTSSNRNFGYALAMSGDGSVVVVGAAQGGNLYGAALVFERGGVAGGAYACTALLRPRSSQQGDSVGTSVAVSADGNSVLVGSSLRFAFLFQRPSSGSAFVEQASGVFAQPNQAAFNEGWSRSVALSGAGSCALIGAPGSQTAASDYRGFAVLYDSAASPPAPATPSPSPTGVGTPSPSASPTPSPTPSPPPSGSLGESASDTLTPSPTPSPPPSGSLGPSASDTLTPTASASASPAAAPPPCPSATAPISASPYAPNAPAARSSAEAAVGGGVGGGLAALLVGGAAALAYSGMAKRRASAAQLTGSSKAQVVVGNPLAAVAAGSGYSASNGV